MFFDKWSVIDMTRAYFPDNPHQVLFYFDFSHQKINFSPKCDVKIKNWHLIENSAPFEIRVHEKFGRIDIQIKLTHSWKKFSMHHELVLEIALLVE